MDATDHHQCQCDFLITASGVDDHSIPVAVAVFATAVDRGLYGGWDYQHVNVAVRYSPSPVAGKNAGCSSLCACIRVCAAVLLWWDSGRARTAVSHPRWCSCFQCCRYHPGDRWRAPANCCRRLSLVLGMNSHACSHVNPLPFYLTLGGQH